MIFRIIYSAVATVGCLYLLASFSTAPTPRFRGQGASSKSRVGRAFRRQVLFVATSLSPVASSNNISVFFNCTHSLFSETKCLSSGYSGMFFCSAIVTAACCCFFLLASYLTAPPPFRGQVA
ncbi:unnamed protein product [Laminaria digitata]